MIKRDIQVHPLCSIGHRFRSNVRITISIAFDIKSELGTLAFSALMKPQLTKFLNAQAHFLIDSNIKISRDILFLLKYYKV